MVYVPYTYLELGLISNVLRIKRGTIRITYIIVYT